MLESAKKMLEEAERDKYAIGQFNINNLEWTIAIISAARQLNAPVILGVTETAAANMGGLRVVSAMVHMLLENYPADLPIALHLDHASFTGCLQAIGAGFTSVMFDGSALAFAENLAKTRLLAKICNGRGVSLEAEIGSPAGEEDNISGNGQKADIAECEELAASGVTCLAPAFGNIHGEYPEGWPGLDFDLLGRIRQVTCSLPLVLHGGTGINEKMLKKAIELGIAKINVNTECQIAFARAMSAYFGEGLDKGTKGYAIQKIMEFGKAAIKDKVTEKILQFGFPVKK